MTVERVERLAGVCAVLGLAVAIGLECCGCAATARTEGVGLVLALDKGLSHRREMTRLKHNGIQRVVPHP